MSSNPQIGKTPTNSRDNKITSEKKGKSRTKEQDLLSHFMKERDLPKWYRGLSRFQMDAADSLLNCIRDDSEQATTHRVRDALIRLGIEPLVSRPKIRLAMRLSRGNDMAFLWFLMELYYRGSTSENSSYAYTLNEQLVMSAIAHLDTIPTLRELDKLLPKQPQKPKPPRPPKKPKEKPNFPLPYFEKQRRPVSYGRSLIRNEIDHVANFEEYDQYLNPNYVVPNESNRWYANYKLNQCQRIANRIIEDQITAVFGKEEAGSLGQSDPVYCAHHETARAIKESMANELAVAKKKFCEKCFDLDGGLKDQSYRRVMDSLNKAIETAQADFNKLTNASFGLGMAVLDIDKNKDKYNNGFRGMCPSKQMISDEYFNKYDYGHAMMPLDKSIYFEAPSYHKPHKFNYNKIFDQGVRNPIKDAIANALNGSGDDLSVDHNRAVRKCCKEIWTLEVQKYRDECAQQERAARIERKLHPPSKEEGLKFDLPYYDPNNKALMTSMLFEAIQEMKKNKKFVLATLPDAHKTPILKEWVKKRYGYMYTRKEKREAFRLSKKVFFVLNKAEIKSRVPEIIDLSKPRVVSYGCKEYLLKKTNYLRENYFHNFRETFLEHTRMYWGGIRAYHCSNGPPRNEFFAYLPSRENDIHMFRTWKPSEFISAKQEWNRRQRKKRVEPMY